MWSQPLHLADEIIQRGCDLPWLHNWSRTKKGFPLYYFPSMSNCGGHCRVWQMGAKGLEDRLSFSISSAIPAVIPLL